MTFLILLAALAGAVLLLGRFGLPEKPLPEPAIPRPGGLMSADAAPWRFEGDSGIAFLICHGFRGTAYNTRPLGEFIHGLGHTAIGVLLPGHGTSVNDMTQSRYYHWRDFLERRYLEERSKYRRLFLIGFSMGGSLCLDIAAKNSDSFRPAGIVTISSPIFFNGFFNGRLVLHQPGMLMTGIIQYTNPVFRMGQYSASGKRINPWIGYGTEFSMAALHSFKCAMPQLRASLGKIAVPYCNIMAANDRTVSHENQQYIFSRIGSREKRAYMLILPSDHTNMHSLLTHQSAQRRVFRYIETFIEDVLGDDSAPEEGRRTFRERLRDFFTGRPPRSPQDLVGPRPRRPAYEDSRPLSEPGEPARPSRESA